jgi:hypothetical protein
MVAKESKSTVGIYKKCKEYYQLPDDERYSLEETPDLYTDLVKKYENVKKLFAGRDYSGLNKHGNTVLLELPNNRYVFIGEGIYEFTAPEKITKYYSLFGNNESPYPVALSKNYAYFMIDKEMIERDKFQTNVDWTDGYKWYYGHVGNQGNMKGTGKNFKKLKIIHKRDTSL